MQYAGIAITIMAAVAPFMVGSPDRTEFDTYPSYKITHGRDCGNGGWLGSVAGLVEKDKRTYGITYSRQWIQHDTTQTRNSDIPSFFRGWLNLVPGADGPAKWIEYMHDRNDGNAVCIVKVDFKIDRGRLSLTQDNTGSFPLGLVARAHGMPWYHAGYHDEVNWQYCGWISGSGRTGPTGYWWDVPAFINMWRVARARDTNTFNYYWGGVRDVSGPKDNKGGNPLPCVARRDESNSTETASVQSNNTITPPSELAADPIKSILGQFLYGYESAKELCSSKDSFGPSFYSIPEDALCDMTTKTLITSFSQGIGKRARIRSSKDGKYKLDMPNGRIRVNSKTLLFRNITKVMELKY